jgi:hypothetical protein
MKKVVFLLFLLLMISCKKESAEVIASTEVGEVKKLSSADNERTVDTIFFSYEEKSKYDDYAVATSLKKEYGEDSLCVANFRLDFIKQDRLIYSHNLQINGYDEGSEWGGFFELDSLASPLRTVILGYPACGYLHHNFLFYVDDKTGTLVHQWESSTDSGWGNWGKIISGTPENFYFRMESYLPSEEENNENEEIGINEFYDSTHFELENNRWTKTLLTEKGKPYRSKRISFDEFH